LIVAIENPEMETILMLKLIRVRLIFWSLLTLVLTIIISPVSYAGGRFIVKDKVIIDTKTKIVWARDANIANNHVTHQEALQFINQMNNKKYAGFSKWELPSDSDFDQSFDHRRYRPNMESYNKRKLQRIGFRKVKDYYYIGPGAVVYPRGGVATQMVSPVKGSDMPGDYGYLWPICRK
jgi:hypothetical protein